MTEYAEQRRLEDKIWFDRFFAATSPSRALPEPAFVSVAIHSPADACRTQIADSMGGEGTFFLRSALDLTDLQQKE